MSAAELLVLWCAVFTFVLVLCPGIWLLVSRLIPGRLGRTGSSPAATWSVECRSWSWRWRAATRSTLFMLSGRRKCAGNYAPRSRRTTRKERTMRDWGSLLNVAELVSRQWTKGQDDHPGVLWPGLEGVLDMLAAYHGDNASEVAALAMTVVGEWWQPGATGEDVARLDRARAKVWRDWPELAELLGRLVAAEKEVRWEQHFPPLAPQGGVTKREARTEYVTRDELADKLDEVYQAIRDVAAYGPECGAAPERPMPKRPPIPPEPTGFGAAVRDVDGDYWVHVGEGSWQFGAPGGTEEPWDGVTRYGPLTVVFEGVES